MGLSSLRGNLKTFVQTRALRLTMPQFHTCRAIQRYDSPGFKTQKNLQAKVLCREVGKGIIISLVGPVYDSESHYGTPTIFISIQLRGNVTYRGRAQIFLSSAVF
jgi:hypothetical protein